MTLRKNTLITVGVTLIGLLLVLFILSQAILMSSFLELEEQDATKNVRRVHDALDDDIIFLESGAAVWSIWDETYDFVNGGSEDYVFNYLMDETFINQRACFMMFYNSSGQLVFAKQVDLQEGEEVPVSFQLMECVSANSFLLEHSDKEDWKTGILLLQDCPVIITSQPIITSYKEGPIGGTFVMGRFLNDAEIEKMGEITHLSLSTCSVNDPNMSSDFQMASSSLSDDGDIIIKSLDEQFTAGYLMLEDIYGNPSLIIKAEMPRDIYGQGKAAMEYLLVAIIGAGIAFGGVTIIFLESSVLSPLEKLNSDVSDIGKCGDPSVRVSMKGKDEIGNLATEINCMLEALESSSQELKSSNELKELFMDILRHDLLNPAGVIKGYTDLLLEMEDEKDKLNIIKKISAGNAKIIDMIESASKIAKLESVEELKFEDLDLGPIFRNVRDDLSIQSDEKQIDVEFKADGVYPSVANRVIEEVFANLLSNAIKYSPDGGSVIIDIVDDGDYWKVMVKDFGEGISDKFKPEIFDRFRRANKGGVKGTGLGLAIVKRIIDLHGGAVGVEDNPAGQGSVFWVTVKKA